MLQNAPSKDAIPDIKDNIRRKSCISEKYMAASPKEHARRYEISSYFRHPDNYWT